MDEEERWQKASPPSSQMHPHTFPMQIWLTFSWECTVEVCEGPHPSDTEWQRPPSRCSVLKIPVTANFLHPQGLCINTQREDKKTQGPLLSEVLLQSQDLLISTPVESEGLHSRDSANRLGYVLCSLVHCFSAFPEWWPLIPKKRNVCNLLLFTIKV